MNVATAISQHMCSLNIDVPYTAARECSDCVCNPKPDRLAKTGVTRKVVNDRL